MRDGNHLTLLSALVEATRTQMAYKDGVPNEEDGGVVSNQIPVSLLSVKLDSKATRITNSVSTTRLTTYMYVCMYV